jgi:hypothetical protein
VLLPGFIQNAGISRSNPKSSKEQNKWAIDFSNFCKFLQIRTRFGFAGISWQNSSAIRQLGRMMKGMPYITERLSSLRQEIADLRNLNARFTEKGGGHNALDQTALELRTVRLREIKQELSKILNRPDDPKVWWERSRRQAV